MKALNSKTANLFKDETTRGIFKAIAEPRTVQIRDLRLKFSDAGALGQSIKDLADANLIKVSEAPIEDFKTLYVTADGLNWARALTRHSAGIDFGDIYGF
jgi:hypothetical protein